MLIVIKSGIYSMVSKQEIHIYYLDLVHKDNNVSIMMERLPAGFYLTSIYIYMEKYFYHDYIVHIPFARKITQQKHTKLYPNTGL